MLDIAAWALVVLVAALLVIHRRLLAAIWWRTEDPRIVAVFRICVGAMLLVHLIDLAPLIEWLYSSEGLATGEQARAMWGRGRWSLLYEFDSPAFVRAYARVQWVACAAFMVGFATPITKWLTWLLFMMMLARNGVDAGGDHVFASYLFYLCLSRCGESYSVDAWIRRRRNPEIAAHRAIPGWPRNLMLLQLVPMMCGNGLAKSGNMWGNGDTLYFALNRPFGGTPNWAMSELFGTNLFRVMTWGAHVFEILFPLAIVGAVIEFARRHPVEPPSPTARRLGYVLFVAIGIDCIALAYLRWGVKPHLPFVLTVLAGLVIACAPLTVRLVRRMPEAARRWLFGPEVWAAILALFGAQLLFFVRIGEWTGVTMCAAILLFPGPAQPPVLPPPADGPSAPARGRQRVARTFIALLCGLHVVAVATMVLPHAKPTATWRVKAELPLWYWIKLTVVTQHWQMFAPGSTKMWQIGDVQVMLRDDRGESIPIGDGLRGADERRLKARSNLAKHERYQKLHARWVCRNVALADGSHDYTVELYLVTERMPTPEELVDYGVDEALERTLASRQWELLHTRDCRE
jgi:hypothetical protein